jgi:hypothetical protein
MKIQEIESLACNTPLEETKLRLKMEFIRTRTERLRAWLTAISIVIPLLLGVGTIIYGVWSENERAKTNFQIKAVEIVLKAESPTIAMNKAIVLYELFPDHLPKNFADKMRSLYASVSY